MTVQWSIVNVQHSLCMALYGIDLSLNEYLENATQITFFSFKLKLKPFLLEIPARLRCLFAKKLCTKMTFCI